MSFASDKFLIIAASFTREISQTLVDGATEVLKKAGVTDNHIDLLWVPGSFEIPLVAKRAAHSDVYDAIICLGCVIRGETSHYDYVAGQAAEGILRASLDHEVPVIFGVLTTEDEDQAWARAGGKVGHKGRESAEAALQMITVLTELDHMARN